MHPFLVGLMVNFLAAAKPQLDSRGHGAVQNEKNDHSSDSSQFVVTSIRSASGRSLGDRAYYYH